MSPVIAVSDYALPLAVGLSAYVFACLVVLILGAFNMFDVRKGCEREEKR